MEGLGIPSFYRNVVRLLGIGEREPGVVDSIVKVETLAKESDAILDRFLVDVRYRHDFQRGLTVASVGAIILLLDELLDSLFAFSLHVANSVGGCYVAI